jgi:hypothetical protein
VAASGTWIQNLGGSKDRERPGGGLRYRDTVLRLQQGQGEARRRPQVQGTEFRLQQVLYRERAGRCLR